jgi:NadR type nicotinamide-nucleotide adenylyltransferase
MHESGLVVGKFAPLHKGHQLLIEAALRQCRRVTILVYSNPDFPDMSQPVRAGWVRTLYPEAIVLEPQGTPPNDAPDETHRDFARRFLEASGIRIDAVFTSEDYGEPFARSLGATHELVDRQRVRAPVSGTALRNDPFALRHFLSPTVYRHFVRTVVFLGAESTGKSTLTAAMAERRNTAFVHEVGRDYYAERGGVLTLHDYVEIARLHQRLEDERLMEARRFLFIDTNALTTLFYSYYYNGGALAQLHSVAAACLSRYDYSFLCAADIPFEQDGWRDTPALREKMQRMVLMDLVNRGIPYLPVAGSLDQRIATVERAVGV